MPWSVPSEDARAARWGGSYPDTRHPVLAVAGAKQCPASRHRPAGADWAESGPEAAPTSDEQRTCRAPRWPTGPKTADQPMSGYFIRKRLEAPSTSMSVRYGRTGLGAQPEPPPGEHHEQVSFLATFDGGVQARDLLAEQWGQARQKRATTAHPDGMGRLL